MEMIDGNLTFLSLTTDSSCVTSTIYTRKNSPSFSSKQHEVEKWLWVMFLWFYHVVQP